MLKRIGIAAWWLGIILSILTIVGLMTNGEGGNNVQLFITGTIAVVICFTTSYILGGSFWTPPK